VLILAPCSAGGGRFALPPNPVLSRSAPRRLDTRRVAVAYRGHSRPGRTWAATAPAA